MGRKPPWWPVVVFAAFSAAVASGCSGSGGGGGGPWLDEPLGPGEVRAGVITRQSELLEGVEAHGWLGDYKMYNSRVAFVIENINEPRGWGPYGGTVLDADVVRAEGEPGEDLFQELIPKIDTLTIYPLSAEIVSDGSDGTAAVLRIEGEQRGIPLIDAATGGALKPRGMNIVQEYILEPEAEYLRIRTTVTPDGSGKLQVDVGDLLLNGDRTTDFVHGQGPGGQLAEQNEYVGGYSERVCYLYFAALSPLGGALRIEGLTLLSAAQGTAERDAPFVVERLLAVGRGGMDDCLRILREARGDVDTGAAGGTVADDGGRPEAGIEVLAHDTSLPEGSDIVSQAFAGQDGVFSFHLPAGTYTFEARPPGREPVLAGPVRVDAGGSVQADIAVPEAARLRISCTGSGGPVGRIPCKLSLQRGHDAPMSAPVVTDYLFFAPSGEAEVVVPAGDWTATLSRGWEYTIHRQNVTASAGQVVVVEGSLERQVDTSGYIAADLHNHSTRSADNGYEIKDKLASNACEGVELVVLTDHDCQSDFTPQLEEMIEELGYDLGQWMRLVTGNEVSPIYAHNTAFPLPSHPTGWIYWQVPWTRYNEDGTFDRMLEYPEILPRERELGAKVINVAHPVGDQGWFTYLGFDPPDVMPPIDSLDPKLFTPDFDTMELLNSKSVGTMLDKILPLWSALNNQGFFRTAVGVSDSHGRTAEAGFGRTMIESSTDSPADMNLEEIWSNLKQHRAMVAGGIFVEIFVGDSKPGDLVDLHGQNKLDVRVRVQAADWVPVEKVWLIANGRRVAEAPLAGAGEVDPAHPAVRFYDTFSVDLAGDTWLAAVAVGPEGSTLNPVFRGARPVGMTNALQIDADGNGRFDPPGL